MFWLSFLFLNFFFLKEMTTFWPKLKKKKQLNRSTNLTDSPILTSSGQFFTDFWSNRFKEDGQTGLVTSSQSDWPTRFHFSSLLVTDWQYWCLFSWLNFQSNALIYGLRILIITPNNIYLNKKANIVLLDVFIIWHKLLVFCLQHVGIRLGMLLTFQLF